MPTRAAAARAIQCTTRKIPAGRACLYDCLDLTGAVLGACGAADVAGHRRVIWTEIAEVLFQVGED